MISRLSRLAVCAAAVGAVAILPACGGGGDKNAEPCKELKNTVADLAKDTSTSNPTAMGQKYKDAAAKVRSEAAKGDGNLKQAGGKLADTFDSLGTTLSGGSTDIDSSGLNAVGKDMSKICD